MRQWRSWLSRLLILGHTEGPSVPAWVDTHDGYLNFKSLFELGCQVVLTKNILRIFFHFVIIPLMIPAPLIFLTYMLTCYSFAHLLICLAEHITTLSSFLLLSKIQYLKSLYVKQSNESFLSLFLASEDLPAHLCSVTSRPVTLRHYSFLTVS